MSFISRSTLLGLSISLTMSLSLNPGLSLAEGFDLFKRKAVQELPEIEVTTQGLQEEPFTGVKLQRQKLQQQGAVGSDSARLLEDIPGVSTYGAGGISSLPTIHGFADDRLRTQVDGMDLMSACPNHMNPALSFIDPANVSTVEVYAGITPVSVGGDSLGGTIQVNSAKPKFAKQEDELLITGKLGTFYRSNGAGRGGNLALTVASRTLNMSYSDAYSQSNNYRAAGDFKLPGLWQSLAEESVSERTVAGTAYRGSRQRELGFAWQPQANHLFELKFGEQSLDWEGFPNQRMDMVSSEPDPDNPGEYRLNTKKPANVNRTTNLHYLGQFEWGELELRYFHQNLRHAMDMLRHRWLGMYMPMESAATTDGGMLKASYLLSDAHTLRLGTDFQYYRLDDWWPGIGLSAGSMCCNDFWNIRNGKRDRIGVYAEWEGKWNPQWSTLLGLRTDQLKSSADSVQGYSATGSYNADVAAFNARDRSVQDRHYDLTALARFSPDATQSYEFGLARKTRSPNLYERFPWSRFAMAALMNNFVGDGNGYVGNPDLKPEVAYTLSASADWHDEVRQAWQFKTTGYVSFVDDYIDAERLSRAGSAGAGCNGNNMNTSNCYVLLQYNNVSARLYGLDAAASVKLGSISGVGSFAASGMASYVRGENRSSGDNLYHLMPLNAKLALEHKLGGWSNTLEMQSVASKDRVSQVRNEAETTGYTLFNLRSSLDWKNTRFEFAVENLFNRAYLLPLGGAYVAQGNAMTSNAIPWGMVVPGRGRSINVALTYSF